MSRMIKWPSIEQFRNVVRHVTAHTRYAGKDENGDAVYDHTKKLPTLRFEGTVKLHGTNASVGFGKGGEMWCQSRENLITPEKDNAGFAMFAHANKEVLFDIACEVDVICKPSELLDCLIFGEWCGGSIHKGVAISGLPKMFVVFGIALVDAEDNKTYLTREQVESVVNGTVKKPEGKIPDGSYIYCIYDFPTYGCTIDFEHPEMSQNIIVRMTQDVEDECPVGKAFGVSGIGEGIVFRCID